MKYIRVKDGDTDAIYELQDNGEWTHNGKLCLFREHAYYNELQKCIVKQADTIEELCDEFIYTGSKFPVCFRSNSHGMWDGTRIESDKDMHKELQNKGYVFYGAIWTDKGLIYVAKMNDKGELKLL